MDAKAKYLIYKVTNQLNGKIYIGQTTKTLEERQKAHFKAAQGFRSNSLFHKAIRKYGIESFIWEILIECDNYEDLDLFELEAIVAYNSIEEGYNLTLGGSGMHGYNHREDVKKRIGNSGRGRVLSKQTKYNMSQGKLNSYKDSVYREKHRQGALRRWADPKQREKRAIEKGSKPFKMFTLDGLLVWEGVCKAECARAFGVDPTSIYRCLEGRFKQHKGYRFQYA